MTNRLDPEDRGILQFRPNIQFVEPEVEAAPPIDLPDDPIQLEDALLKVQQVKQLAKAVDLLAGTVQARADELAKNMIVSLDSSADTDTVQAMLRHFPGQNPNEITYAQYKACKDEITRRGVALGQQGLVTPAEVQAARDQAQAAGPNAGTNLGGFGTPEANLGGLRPELNRRVQIIPPMNIPELQISLICILINFIWKEFVKPFISNTSPPVSWAFNALPDQICDPGADIELPGLIILGRPPNKLPEPPDIPTNLAERFDI